VHIAPLEEDQPAKQSIFPFRFGASRVRPCSSAIEYWTNPMELAQYPPVPLIWA
jgi:hypothetical protein